MMYSNRSRNSTREPKRKSSRSARDKKLSKLIASDSEGEGDSEHELSHYSGDRVKLMKQVLKIMKPRKIKSMAPDCMKNMDLQEINSMLLEELLGISNKRLKYIFEGKILDEESSTDEDQPIDVISLDDISDDDFVVISDEEVDKRKGKHKRKKVKLEPKDRTKKVKKEKPDKDKGKPGEKSKEKPNRKQKEAMNEENLMSVLELLELQARARAIRSQLELESKRKQENRELAKAQKEKQKLNGQEEDDEVIMEVPHDVEIVINSSDSDNELEKAGSSNAPDTTQSSVGSPGISNIQILEEGDNNKANECNNSDKEHVSDGEISQNNKNDRSNENVGNPASSSNVEVPEKALSSKEDKDDSDSNSSDNLQVIMEREKRKIQKKKKHLNNTKSKTTMNQANQENKELDPETTENPNRESESIDKEAQTAITQDSNEENPNKIDAAIQEFIKTQPPPPTDEEELKKAEEETKNKKEKLKRDKEKRLKSLKNKLQSFKQDVAVESGPVTVLENIIIKPKAPTRKHLEHSDDLVINVDQDDLDCIVCD